MKSQIGSRCNFNALDETPQPVYNQPETLILYGYSGKIELIFDWMLPKRFPRQAAAVQDCRLASLAQGTK